MTGAENNNIFSLICTVNIQKYLIKAMDKKEYYLSRSEYIRAAVSWGLQHISELDYSRTLTFNSSLQTTTINLMHWQNALVKKLNDIIGMNRSQIIRVMIFNFIKHLNESIPNLYKSYVALQEQAWEEQKMGGSMKQNREFVAHDAPIPGQDADSIAILKMWDQMKQDGKVAATPTKYK